MLLLKCSIEGNNMSIVGIVVRFVARSTGHPRMNIRNYQDIDSAEWQIWRPNKFSFVNAQGKD